MKLRLLATLALALATTGAAQPTQAATDVRAWVTTADGARRLSPDAVLPARAGGDAVTITVDPTKRYQSMVGFGAAITDATAQLIEGMAPTPRKALMADLFGTGPQALGIGFTRLTIGASDFSSSDYSYDDMARGQADPSLAHFSIDPARKAMLPVARAALAVQPKLTVMASPWSPPGWMKTSDSMIGGTLKPDAYAPYARYFVHYLKAVDGAGVGIDYLTIQNEPNYSPGDYPGMKWAAADRAKFDRDYLGPALAQARLKTKILEWDHNWDLPEQPLTALADPKASRYIDGVAWHCYAGEPGAQSKVHAAHPDKDVFFTECSGGDWSPGWKNGLHDVVGNLLIGATRNWARGVLLWNIALDPDKGPHFGGCATCRGLVTIDPKTGGVERTIDYYALAHASRFVRIGARRIASSEVPGRVETVAFVNPNGGRVLIAYNPNAASQTLSVRAPEPIFNYRLPPGAAATFLWGK